MSDRKTYYYIEVDREKAALIWALLSENYNKTSIHNTNST